MDPVLRAVARRAPQAGLSLARGNGRGVLVLCSRRQPTDAHLRAVATDARDSLLHALNAPAGVTVGIGPTVDQLTDAAVSARRAWQAVAVADSIRGLGDVVVWDDLGIYKLLARLPQQDIEDTLPDGLVRLLETPKGGVLVETLETWLDNGGDPRDTIAALSIHRTSLYYRLNRIEEVTGMWLANGDDRLALHLGLKIARLLGRSAPTG
jgi:sugar diacid utilization regulator